MRVATGAVLRTFELLDTCPDARHGAAVLGAAGPPQRQQPFQRLQAAALAAGVDDGLRDTLLLRRQLRQVDVLCDAENRQDVTKLARRPLFCNDVGIATGRQAAQGEPSDASD